MVHALHETHRVLKPDGLLIDLRPAAVHRRVGLVQGDDYRLRWVMRETFEDDHAADRAVAQVVGRDGLFKPEQGVKFDCYRIMDSIEDFRGWLDDFIKKGNFESHDWLIERVEREVELGDGNSQIAVGSPLVLQALRKITA